MTHTNFLLATDSYKHSHFLQFPPEAQAISSYIEARDNDFYDEAVFMGLQPYLIDYLAQPIDHIMVNEAKEVCAAHGVPFNEEGWRIIVDEFGGKLPIQIEALPEGTVVPTGVPMVQVTNTDPRFYWLPNFIETALLRAIWYPTTVATLSRICKKLIMQGLEMSSDDPEGQIHFKLQDFGARGVSSAESAALGGMAHMVNFMGSDTLEGIMAARRYYLADMAGYSIPASEHSTMTSWGKGREADAYRNMLKRFNGGLVAIVSDSYDLDNAVDNIFGDELKGLVLSQTGTLVVRPDSGDPVETPIRVLKKLWRTFGGTTNSKGYKVLDSRVRVIQGDGMDVHSIKRLIERCIEEGFSIDNITVGMGGGLLQKVNRDTLRFAMKANAMKTAEGWQDVQKNPATDPTKASKAGRQAVIQLDDGTMKAIRHDDLRSIRTNLLKTVYRNGALNVSQTWDEVKGRAAL